MHKKEDTINYRIEMANHAVFHVIISLAKDEKLWKKYTIKPWCGTSAIASVMGHDFKQCNRITCDMLNYKKLNVFSSEGGLFAAHKLMKEELKNLCDCDVLWEVDY